LADAFAQLSGALICTAMACIRQYMGRASHPLRSRALHLMRDGLASPHEIAAALSIPCETVQSWRQRAGIRTDAARIEHVRRLLERKPRIIPVIDDPDAAPY
jgi:hypothetical protein